MINTMLLLLCLFALSESSLIKQARIDSTQTLSKTVDPISFNPLIPASHFRKHLEDSDEYADLYCTVERIIRSNYEWAELIPKK